MLLAKQTQALITGRSRSVCFAHGSHYPEREAPRSEPLCVQGCEIWNGNCPIESAIALVHQIEQPQGGNGLTRKIHCD